MLLQEMHRITQIQSPFNDYAAPLQKLNAKQKKLCEMIFIR